MPQSKKSSMAATDHISALPDAILSHILTFLHAKEAVQSCVLARRWLHLWKSLPVLRVTGGHLHESCQFMEHLLTLRDRSPLDACILNFDSVDFDNVRYVMLWIRYALLCQVRALNVAFSPAGFPWRISSEHLVSQNLTKLKLGHTCVQGNFLDFSNCPALEELKMTKCFINSDRISSPSLKSLSIVECYLSDGPRFRISGPSIISLEIALICSIPFLEDMPGLVTATITFHDECGDPRARLEEPESDDCGNASCDCCRGDSYYCGNARCEYCYGPDDANNAGCMLLNGLSAATNLKLVAESEAFILKRDLRWCPTFSNLKTLFLNGWCVAANQHALICILQHSPVLENLILQLSETPEDISVMKTTYNVLHQPFASENLKKVEVACKDVDQRVHNIVKSLSTYGIPLEKIYIKQTNKSSECFDFVCRGFSSKQGGQHLGC